VNLIIYRYPIVVLSQFSKLMFEGYEDEHGHHQAFYSDLLDEKTQRRCMQLLDYAIQDAKLQEKDSNIGNVLNLTCHFKTMLRNGQMRATFCMKKMKASDYQIAVEHLIQVFIQILDGIGMSELPNLIISFGKFSSGHQEKERQSIFYMIIENLLMASGLTKTMMSQENLRQFAQFMVDPDNLDKQKKDYDEMRSSPNLSHWPQFDSIWTMNASRSAQVTTSLIMSDVWTPVSSQSPLEDD
jgi:hypothetical protein